MWTEVLETLDWPERPELYVTQTPIANAMAVGFDKPFVIVHSGLLEMLDEEELRSVLGHELGHIMSGHTTYTHDRLHPALLRPEQPSVPRRRGDPSVPARAARVAAKERVLVRPRRPARGAGPERRR